MSLSNFVDFIIDGLKRLWVKSGNTYILDETAPPLEPNPLGYSPVAISEGRLYHIGKKTFLPTSDGFEQVLYHGDETYSCRRSNGRIHLIKIKSGYDDGEIDNYIVTRDAKLIIGDIDNQWSYPYLNINDEWKWVRIKPHSLHSEAHKTAQQLHPYNEIIKYNRGIIYTDTSLIISHRSPSDTSRDLISIPVKGSNVISAHIYYARRNGTDYRALVLLYYSGNVSVTYGKDYASFFLLVENEAINNQSKITPWKNIESQLLKRYNGILLLDQNHVLHKLEVNIAHRPYWTEYHFDDRIFDRPIPRVKNARNK